MAGNGNGTALAEVGSTSIDQSVGTLSELPAFDRADPAMVFMAQIAHRWSMAKMLVKSGMIPQKTPEAAIAVMLKGHELGVTPMVAFANMFFFDGKLGMSADLMTALFIQKAGGKLQVLKWTEEACRIRFTRTGWEPSEVEYTIADAQAAGLLGKANWKNRKAMLSARVRAMGVRLLAPETFAGTYSTEELLDMEAEAVTRRAAVASQGATRTEQIRNRLAAVPTPIEAGAAEESDFPAEVRELAQQVEEADAAGDDVQEKGPTDEAREKLNRQYFAQLKELGWNDADRRAFQKRLADNGLVSATTCGKWKAQDYRSALAELAKIPGDAEDGEVALAADPFGGE